jgi:hypothetical protein
MSVQPVNPNSLGVGFSLHLVLVEQIVLAHNTAICQEVSTKHRMEVSLTPIRVRIPKVDEVWIIDQTFGVWSFAATVQTPTQFVGGLPAVTGARSGADPVTLSLLAALVQIGLVTDETV